MTIRQFIFDDFNDNSFNTNKWSVQTPASNTHSESGGRLLTPAALSAAPTVVRSYGNWYNIADGHLAVQISKSGTMNADTYTYFGVRDWDNTYFTVFARSNDANVQIASNGGGAGVQTSVETTIGMGPSLPANTWVGWRYTVATRTMSLQKSSTGTSGWTEIWKWVFNATPTFNWKQCGIILGATCYGTLPTFQPSWDNVSYFVDHTMLYNRVRVGGAWVNATPKVRVGGAWKHAIPRVYQTVGGIGDWYRAK